MTLGELLRRVSSRELTEWIAFYAIEAEDEARALAASKTPDARAQRPP